ncbi:class I SAM-dependent methyltransferase [Flavobacterium sp. 3HN19-14]|uniref:class I SAM-dependent methyltransferase n=1 Tax=Flavobacterium sp. 3HN19-14 TaxID=3448133 RepID=UPI003EE37930
MDSSQKHFLSVKDFSVSGEVFELYKDENLDMLITTPQPKGEDLNRYYESEDYISHTDGKRTFFEKIYQFIKNIALDRKVKLINSLAKQKGNLLDIGAGTGDFLLRAKNDGWNITGVEPSSKAKEIATQKGLSLFDESTGIKSGTFDIITMWHVLEHVPDLDFQIKELKRLLKPNGHIIIAVPNFNSYDAEHYGAFWAAYDVPRHLWHFSKTAIEKLFAKESFQLVLILPMQFDAYYVSLLSEKYKTGKMNFIRAFFTGLQSNSKAKRNTEYSSHIYVIKNA